MWATLSYTIVAQNDYYAFGLKHENPNLANHTSNRYLYNGKEEQTTGVVDLLDYGARMYDATLARFGKPDRFAEKYYNLSSYGYVAGNPIRNIDINGDSIYVSDKYREMFNNSLKDVFNSHSSNFTYSESGMLTYSGNKKDLNRQQRRVLKGMLQVMNEATITEIIYDNSLSVVDNGENTITFNLQGLGSNGIAFLGSENNLDKNYILINPTSNPIFNVYAVTSAYYRDTPITENSSARFTLESVSTNITDILFHEIGHIIYQGQTQDKVLKYNNIIRKIIGLPKRPYDETHNKKVKNEMF